MPRSPAISVSLLGALIIGLYHAYPKVVDIRLRWCEECPNALGPHISIVVYPAFRTNAFFRRENSQRVSYESTFRNGDTFYS